MSDGDPDLGRAVLILCEEFAAAVARGDEWAAAQWASGAFGLAAGADFSEAPRPAAPGQKKPW